MGKLSIVLAVALALVTACKKGQDDSGRSCDEIAASYREASGVEGTEQLVLEFCREASPALKECLSAMKNSLDFERCGEMYRADSRVKRAAGRYDAKSKTTEAMQFTKKLSDGARAYAMELTDARPTFPPQSAGPTPPVGSCCESGGRCQADPSLWVPDTWKALNFSVDDPHYYSYQYEVSDGGQSFVVRAIGDLDCDGVYSTFEMSGRLVDGQIIADRELVVTNELE